METKICRKCLLEKPLDQFFLEKRSADGKRYSCKLCDKARRIMYLTGLSMDQWEERKALRKNHAPKERDYSHQRRTIYRAKALVYLAKQRAAKKGVPFDLDQHAKDLQERINAGFCELTGVPFRLDEPRSFDSPSLDRIVPELGYTYANVRVVCYAMNCALGTWGEAPLLLMLEAWKKKKES